MAVFIKKYFASESSLYGLFVQIFEPSSRVFFYRWKLIYIRLLFSLKEYSESNGGSYKLGKVNDCFNEKS